MTDSTSPDSDLIRDDDTDDEATVTEASSGEATGAIGPYRLLQRIGEGGMGEVWLAEQIQPVHRRVALKVIKAGMDTKQVVARFEAERQALALMDHPSIAKVFDAGETPQGRPYFVMEHVQGVPITEHCDRQRLSNRERLDLFLQVCEGVQHAHQKAIIHRDIKPSNVLVTMQDGKAVPKIIDFGVAKATSQRLTEKTMFTELGVLIGTPEYMSPEQAEMTGQDVDTRTDVYSLGVMLYELLVGALPFDSKALRSGGFEGIVRKIREDEPPKPSVRVSALGDQATESANRRRVELPTLRSQLRGDLDWITMKALEKDRTRRYGSPAELASDVARHMKYEPVLAGPPSAAYRARKFVRRHRMGVAAAATSVIVLIGFAVIMAVQARRIAREAETANKTAEFLTRLFEVSDPSEARGNTITAREILDRGAKRLASELATEPLVRARLMQTVGQVYRNLGLFASSRPLLERSLSLRRDLLGDSHPDTLESINNLGELLWALGQNQDAERYLREALEGRRRVLGDDNPGTLLSISNMGMLLQALGKFDEAERYFREALEGRRRVLGADHPDTLLSMNNMGFLFWGRGRPDAAEPYFREALEGRRRVLGDDHPDTLFAMANLGFVIQARGQLAEAEPYFHDALEGRRRVLGHEHPDTLISSNNMGFLLLAQGKLDEAEAYYRETLEARRRLLGSDHPDTLLSVSNMGLLRQAQGRLDEAEVYLREALEGRRRLLGSDSTAALVSMSNLGFLLLARGELREAESCASEALEGLRRALGDDHPDTLNAMINLGEVYTSEGRLDDADGLLATAVANARRALPAGHRVTGKALNGLGRCLSARRACPAAETALLEARGILGRVDANLARDAERNLAALYRACGKPDESAASHAEASTP